MVRNILMKGKLDTPYLGPYKIVPKTRGGNAYILMDAVGTVLVRKFPPDHFKIVTCDDFAGNYYVERILDHKVENEIT